MICKGSLALPMPNELLVFLLIAFGGAPVVILAEPATLHREAFHLPIEYVLFLPLRLAYMGLSALKLHAMRHGRVGKAGLIGEMGPLWFFIYPILFGSLMQRHSASDRRLCERVAG